jgi:hypothetical protein
MWNEKSHSSPHQMLRVTPLYAEWLLSTSKVKIDSTHFLMWRVIALHIKCEELPLTTANLKSDSSTSNVKSYSTSNVKSDSTSNVKSYSSPHQKWRVTPLRQIWRVAPLYIKCKDWLHSTSNVKRDSSPRQNNVKSVTPLHRKCEEWLLSTPNVKSDSSSHLMFRVTSFHITREEWFLFTSYVTIHEKRGILAQNVKSCYEPVKFTFHIGNVSTAVVSFTNIFGTKWDIDLIQIPLNSL